MARSVMNVYVNDICIRTCGGNKKEIRELTDWYNHANSYELSTKHNWIKPTDKVFATRYNK